MKVSIYKSDSSKKEAVRFHQIMIVGCLIHVLLLWSFDSLLLFLDAPRSCYGITGSRSGASESP